eukprot:6084614-Prymnesium_polylepis.1
MQWLNACSTGYMQLEKVTLALQVLAKVDASELAPHAGTIVPLLASHNESTRQAALRALACLHPAALVQHASALLMNGNIEALQTLGNLQ